MRAIHVRHIVALALLALFAIPATGVDAQQARNAQLTPRTTIGDVPLLATSPAAGYRLQNAPRSRRWEGAAIGVVIGAVATHFILHSGGSTSLCDRDRNQDAMNARECTGITALGGVVGGVAGYFIGGRIRVGRAP